MNENMRYKLTQIAGYIFIALLYFFSEIYGIKNTKKIGDKLIKLADKMSGGTIL